MKRLLLVLLLASSSLFAALNLNTATKDQLTKVKGIGGKKAEAIIKYRESHGKFKNLKELESVNGFGSKSVEKLKGALEVK